MSTVSPIGDGIPLSDATEATPTRCPGTLTHHGGSHDHADCRAPAVLSIRRRPTGEAERAAAAFLARYQGRTLGAYRYDLRSFFQWAAEEGIEILRASRPQIECYVRAMEDRGLAATTIDRRLSTVCGFYRFAHID